MKRWNLEETARAIGEIVDEHLDHVDKNASTAHGCRYIDDHGYPSCIVGVFLVNKVGLDVDFVKHLDEAANGMSAQIHKAPEEYLQHMTPEAVEYLDCVQNTQDDGRTWGYAREQANLAFLPNNV